MNLLIDAIVKKILHSILYNIILVMTLNVLTEIRVPIVLATHLTVFLSPPPSPPIPVSITTICDFKMTSSENNCKIRLHKFNRKI